MSITTATQNHSEATISLKRPVLETIEVEIVGTSPLIVHAWSQKAREMMLASQQGKKLPKVAKDPHQDFLDSRYYFADGSGDGFPITGVKQACVKGAGRSFGKSVKMTELRQSLLFLEDGMGTDGQPLVRVLAQEPTPREDMVRVGNGTADIRYRAEFKEWGMLLRVKFNPNIIDAGSVVAIIDAGGQNGIGEWRPEKNGNFGTFEVNA
jgi:hypothetical protein